MMLPLAVLVLFLEDGVEGGVVDTMVLGDGAVDVETKSASVLTVDAVLPLG